MAREGGNEFEVEFLDRSGAAEGIEMRVEAAEENLGGESGLR